MVLILIFGEVLGLYGYERVLKWEAILANRMKSHSCSYPEYEHRLKVH